MRPALTLAVLLAAASLASPALAFDVQNGGGAPASGGSANLSPDAAAQAGVSLDTDLRAQLGMPEDKTKTSPLAKSGLQFGGGVFTGPNSANTSSMGYDESPWVAPRKPPGRD